MSKQSNSIKLQPTQHTSTGDWAGAPQQQWWRKIRACVRFLFPVAARQLIELAALCTQGPDVRLYVSLTSWFWVDFTYMCSVCLNSDTIYQ